MVMPVSRRGTLVGFAGAWSLFATRADAAVDCESAGAAPADWPQLTHFARDNAQRVASRTSVSTVFMGDSITAGWIDRRPGFFSAGRVNRGIGGQTTPQMLLRMMADVVALGPKNVHIMGGTNDIAGNTGPISVAQTIDNVAAMAAVARSAGVRVLVASVPPAASYPWRQGLDVVAPTRAINAGLADLCARRRYHFVDYHQVLADADGGMRPGLAYDGVHPSEAGYAAMESLVGPMLARWGG